MELQEALSGRHSVRKFTDYQVTDADIKTLLEAARIAPSWANTQVWEFVVIRGKDTIAKIVASFSEKNPATKGALEASALIVACAKTGASGSYDGHAMTKHQEWFMFDLGMAVQNLCLKAYELDLGTVVVGLMDHAACQKAIGLPEGYEVVAVLPIGRPVAKREGPPRKELKDFVHLNTFGTPFF
jgi:nitroreductase